ncbi:MAG: RimK/LysX family protein [Longimicrobiales bacterium]|nr:RimK/LysX family protein [Longimicrobiales bacterium]
MAPKTRVGWREWIGLPDLDISRIKAKVDTGARSSALHAFAIEPFEREGDRWVRFKVHPRQRDDAFEIACEAPMVEKRRVKSSSGTTTDRPVVLTRIEWMGERWEIELTLVRRDQMGFRCLIGRQAMRRRWIVDPATSFVGGNRRPFREARRRDETNRKREASRAPHHPHGHSEEE